jgi:hypothetical protein
MLSRLIAEGRAAPGSELARECGGIRRDDVEHARTAARAGCPATDEQLVEEDARPDIHWQWADARTEIVSP